MKVATRAKRKARPTPGYQWTYGVRGILRANRPMAYRINPDHSVTPLGPHQVGAWNMGQPEARVAFDELGGPCYASTVFVGTPQAPWLQIRQPDAPPLLFETMARIGPNGIDEIRRFYATWEEAEAGHAEIIAEHRAIVQDPHSFDGRDYDDE